MGARKLVAKQQSNQVDIAGGEAAHGRIPKVSQISAYLAAVGAG